MYIKIIMMSIKALIDPMYAETSVILVFVLIMYARLNSVRTIEINSVELKKNAQLAVLQTKLSIDSPTIRPSATTILQAMLLYSITMWGRLLWLT